MTGTHTGPLVISVASLKGGVGKTSLSTASAIALADAGKRVLLVSTDAASNLDEMLGVPLSNAPLPVPGVPGLSLLNIDPNSAADSYRSRVLVQMEETATEAEIATVREQLSGACTTEIASFDEFSSLLAGGAQGYDHVVFDTAPNATTNLDTVTDFVHSTDKLQFSQTVFTGLNKDGTFTVDQFWAAAGATSA